MPLEDSLVANFRDLVERGTVTRRPRTHRFKRARCRLDCCSKLHLFWVFSSLRAPVRQTAQDLGNSPHHSACIHTEPSFIIIVMIGRLLRVA